MIDIGSYSGSGIATAGFITAFFVVLLAIPSLIKVAKLKHLVDEPSEDRKLHSRSVPTIGGIVIFGAIIFSYSLWFPEHYDSLPHHMLANFKYLIAILILLFFVGVKDDIIGTDPLKKLVAHVMVGFILVVMAEIRIESMHGLFGVYTIDESFSMLLSLFVYIVIVNAVNLIDGLDGLAAGIGFIIAMAFGFLFYFNHNVPLSLLGFVLAGALLGFLVFNFSPARIFMGDSGSLTIGAIISVLALNAVNIDVSYNPEWLKGNMPILVMAILVYPLVDTLRVFTIRALKGQSPFTADKNHIHHRFIVLGYSHRQTVLRLYGLNVSVIIGAFLIEKYVPVNVTIQFLLILAVAAMLTLIPFVMKPKSPVCA